MPTTRSQSKAMSTPQTSPTQQEPESPKNTSSQESTGSTISQETPESILTEFRQPLQVQSHLEMSRILDQLGHIQCT